MNLNSNIFLVKLMIYASISLFISNNSYGYELEELIEESSHSVVTIQSYYLLNGEKDERIGTGFSILDQNLIVTNYHVIEKAYSVEIITNNNVKYIASGILAQNIPRDLAILLINDSNIPPLKLLSLDISKPGEKIFVIGSPRGLSGSSSSGIVSAIRPLNELKVLKKISELKFIQITAPISKGSSGSPVFNTSNEVIGVVTGQFNKGQNINFAIPSYDLHQLLNEIKSDNLIYSFPNKYKYYETIIFYKFLLGFITILLIIIFFANKKREQVQDITLKFLSNIKNRNNTKRVKIDRETKKIVKQILKDIDTPNISKKNMNKKEQYMKFLNKIADRSVNNKRILIVVIIISMLIIIYLNHNSGVLTYNENQGRRFVNHIIIPIPIFCSLLFFEKIRKNIKYLAIWVGIFFLFLIFRLLFLE
ncbi:membrane protein containing Peptidase S1 and S6, chymotrypsin/Hap domain protein [Candidatus Magnetomorum sp. HK-1]|nr:membrane protein containing Peptidase S1 and S6, chymotrypsin/Hap domain protein [Candidatus Magnetomorum sp. HK-1]